MNKKSNTTMNQNNAIIESLWDRAGFPEQPTIKYIQYMWDLFIVIYDVPNNPVLRIMDIDGNVYLVARDACEVVTDATGNSRYNVMSPEEMVRISCQKTVEQYDADVYSRIAYPLIHDY